MKYQAKRTVRILLGSLAVLAIGSLQGCLHPPFMHPSFMHPHVRVSIPRPVVHHTHHHPGCGCKHGRAKRVTPRRVLRSEHAKPK